MLISSPGSRVGSRTTARRREPIVAGHDQRAAALATTAGPPRGTREAYGARVKSLMPLARALRDSYYESLDPRQRAALLSWLAFSATFSAARGITLSIRAGRGPFRNLSAGGEHLHHYLWGIGMLAGVGAVAVHGEDSRRRHPVVAISYGSGLALIVDEFALLLDLKDVYWTRQGRVSVDLGVFAIASAGSYFAALPVLRATARKRPQRD